MTLLRLVRAGLALVAAYTATTTGYLILIGAAAAVREPRRWARRDPEPSVVVLVPAHDEEDVIERCVRSLLDDDFPVERREVIVIADNCRDRTVEIASATGATAWERDDPGNPGKGQAVAWALDRLRRERSATEVVVMVDADCIAHPGSLRELAGAVAAGADAVQAAYAIDNPGASTAAALRYAGFALVNVVRPRGKDALGLSCGLLGSGMAFPRRTLEAVGWNAFSVTEDREYHLRLIESGRRARFAPRALITSPAPVGDAAGAVQQMRWETGNAVLGRAWIGRLVLGGLRRRDWQRVHAGLELGIGPLSLVVAPALCATVGGVLTASPRVARTGALTLVGQSAYVLGGLRLVGAPPSVYRGLSAAPGLMARRLRQYVRIAVGRGASAWVRTERNA